MAKKKGVISGREAQRRADAAKRKKTFKAARRGDAGAIQEVTNNGERRTSVIRKLLG